MRSDEPTRRWIASLWLLALLAVPALRSLAQTSAPPTNSTVILSIENRMEILRAGAQRWDNAQTNQILDPGDQGHTFENSRATLRLSDLSVARVNENTVFRIEPIPRGEQKSTYTLLKGLVHLFHRGKPLDVKLRTPVASAAIRGTEIILQQDEAGRTVLTVLEGEVDLSNLQEQSISLHSGEQGIVEVGQPPRKTAVIDAQNVIQWCLYYPAVLDIEELELAALDREALADSLAAYRSGDLLQGLAKYPVARPPGSAAERIYLAALVLAVGQVEKAEGLLGTAAPSDGQTDRSALLAAALRKLIAAVKGQTNASTLDSQLATSLLSESYYEQSQSKLAEALRTARKAVENSPQFGFGWARVAELEFSFGRIPAARDALERSLALAPRNAQALALQGFLLSAENHVSEAVTWFDKAIAIDGALGNAWLGRGLCRIRQGKTEEGRKDLEVAAATEPQRSLLRSYLGKAWSETGHETLAARELDLAKKLDANDPTPWLYSALLNRETNRINEAVRDLERSIELNDNRAVYRSQLLLDQDRAVRNASLAKIYQDAGMDDVSLREAARAVSYDYANHSAHQFLAESYNALRDPTRFNLRYETVWFNELLLANLLSPVGAGLLSQNISQQEYSRLFEANGFGLLTSTEFRSDGQTRQIASQSGSFGGTSYSLDLDHQQNDGVRPNNDLERLEWYTQFKQQLSSRDSMFILTKYQDYESGDNFQHYDPAFASRTLRVEEKQSPIVLAALHREWQPGVHTTLLAGYLDSDFKQTSDARVFDLWTNSPPPGINWVRVQSFDSLRAEAKFTAYLAELNQIWQTDRHVSVLGGRLQAGSFDVGTVIDGSSPFVQDYYDPPISTELDEPFHRGSLYGYHTWEMWDGFRLTAGLTYDYLDYPSNFRSPPLSDDREERDQLSPKVSLHWDVHARIALRGIYAQSVGGLSFDESVRLEPTQLAGFSQAFRNIISESEVGSVTAPKYEVGGLALDMKLRDGTFLGLQAHWQRSDVDQEIGVFKSTGDLAPPPQAVSASTQERLCYEERSLLFTVNQLLGDEWSLGAGYELTHSRLRWSYPEIPVSLPLSPSRTEEALLQRISLHLQYQHPSGLFARAQSRWFIQDNEGYGVSIYTDPRPGDSVYQLDLFAGYRLWQRRGELTFGCLNVTDQDYRLNSLTPYPDLPRERVWIGRLRLTF